MVKILNVVGARPNFMKMAPIIAAINRRPNEISQTLVHTGQHYDEAMSAVFFGDLRMPEPDISPGNAVRDAHATDGANHAACSRKF